MDDLLVGAEITSEITSCSFGTLQTSDSGASRRRHQKWTPFLLFSNFAVVVGSSFTFGYNLAVINGPFYVMRQWINETFASYGQLLSADELNTQWTLVCTLYLIGGVVGSTYFPNLFSSRFGKRDVLIFGAIIGAIGELLLFIARYTGSFYPFMVGRFVTGFQGGISTTIAPALLNEHAPARLKGTIGTAYCLALSSGVQLANFLALSFILGSQYFWPWLFVVPFSLYIIHGVSLLFCVESPQWLLKKRREQESLKALSKLRNLDENWEVRREFEQLKLDSAFHSTSTTTVTAMDIVRTRQFYWPIFIAINIHIANQFTGFTAVAIYASLVFTDAGLGPDSASLANFGIFWATIVGNVICGLTVDRIGRRKLMLTGTLGMAVIDAVVVVLFQFKCYEGSIAAFALFLAFFGCGPGPIPWFMSPELFTHHVSPLALSITTFTNWACNNAVSFVFPILQFKFGYYSFLPFAVIGLLEFIFLLLFLPETAAKLARYTPEMFAPGQPLLVHFKRKTTTVELSERSYLFQKQPSEYG